MKNSLLELRRKPGKLVLYIILILLLGGMIAFTALRPTENTGVSDIVYLKGIIYAFFMIFFISAIVSGLSQGSDLFGMEDVNLLFVSPVNPRSILLYGVIRVVKKMALASVFILFQGSTLRTFGVGAGGLGVLYTGYLLTAVVSQLLSMLIYNMTNGRKSRQRLVKALAILIFVPLLLVAARQMLTASGDLPAALRNVLASPEMSFTPIPGWASAGIVAFVTGETASGALFFGLLFLAGMVSVAAVYIGKPDYYEDVLVASETAFERKRSLAESSLSSLERSSKKRIRTKRTGVGGLGAAALFGKHIRESFRANCFGLWGIPTVIMTAGAAAFILIMKLDGETDSAQMMLIMLGILMWVQIFIVGTGRGLIETYSHYIYMIPESPFKKMVWCNLEIMLKSFVEGVLICMAAGLVAGAGAAVIALFALAYTLFVFLLVAVNFVFMRFTGSDISTGFLIMLYVFAVLLVMLPGITLAIAAGMFLGIPWALAALSGWELVAALGGFYTSRGVLHNCDMAMLRQVGK
jgi:hypothetical protein